MSTTTANQEGPTLARAASHAAELITLQGRLLLADLRESAGSLRVAIALAVIGAVLCLAAAVVGLAGLAMIAVDLWELSPAAALLLSAAVAALLGAALGFAAIRSSREAAALVARSYDDLEANLKTLTPDT